MPASEVGQARHEQFQHLGAEGLGEERAVGGGVLHEGAAVADDGQVEAELLGHGEGGAVASPRAQDDAQARVPRPAKGLADRGAEVGAAVQQGAVNVDGEEAVLRHWAFRRGRVNPQSVIRNP